MVLRGIQKRSVRVQSLVAKPNSLCVHVSVWICVKVYIYVCAYMCVSVRDVYLCVQICVYMCGGVYLCVCIMCIYVCMRVCVYIPKWNTDLHLGYLLSAPFSTSVFEVSL